MHVRGVFYSSTVLVSIIILPCIYQADFTEGIQAQTLSVFHHAAEADLTLLAVINKVDLPHAAPDETSEQIALSLGLEADKHMRISAKSGLGVDQVLRQIIEGLPSPQPREEDDGKLRGLVFDHLWVDRISVISMLMKQLRSLQRCRGSDKSLLWLDKKG